MFVGGFQVFAASAHQQQAPRSAAILVNENFDEPQISNCARRLYIMFVVFNCRRKSLCSSSTPWEN